MLFLVGQIDLLKKVDENGTVTEVEVIDFKTDRNDSIYQGDYEKQVRFYAIACLESLGLKPEKAYIHHLDQNLKTEVNISPMKLEEIKTEISEQIRSIMNQKFYPKNSYDVCKECDYKLICPNKGFKLEIPN